MTELSMERNYHYFMEADISSYTGKWIAILEDKVIAHGKNIKEVVSQAQAISKGKKFLLAKVPSKETMIF